ncbi:MAG: glycosyltransferase family 9 protein [Bdellovibrionales bacterium]|nr:glycosyltransferase family 9 protein [Bdellovibrionales bacterium]
MRREPIRIAVVQLARLGDSVQSLMALRAAQQLYPELEITYVAHESFAVAAERCPWIHRVVKLPTDSLLRPLVNGKRKARGMIPEIAAWIEPLAERTFDMVVNWTYSEASSYLTGILPARVRIGYSRRRDGTLSVVDGWSHYIHSIVQTETLQSIHLTDILTTQLLTALQIHFDDPVEENDGQTVTSKSFFEIKRSPFVCDGWNHPGIRWIALQLGASSEEKTWSPAAWAKLASMILRRHDDTRIILLGGNCEKEIEAKFFEALRAEERTNGTPSAVFEKRLHSKVGKTAFDQWAQILADAQWTISADTAAIHLASVLGTRVLNVSVGPVRFRETGPYGNGHYVVRAPSPESPLSPEAVYASWTYASTEWQHRRELPFADHLRNLESSDLLGKMEVFRSKIRPADVGGGIHFETLIDQRITLANWYGQVLGHLAREWYCGWVPPVGQELERTEVSPELVQNLRKLSEGIEVLDKIYGEIIRTADDLFRKTKTLKSEHLMKLSDREKIHELGKKLEELETLSERVGTAQEPLQAIHRLSKILMHNLTGKRVSEVAEETVGVYRFLRIGVGGLRNWTNHTLGLARPVAVASSSSVVSLADRRAPSA